LLEQGVLLTLQYVVQARVLQKGPQSMLQGCLQKGQGNGCIFCMAVLAASVLVAALDIVYQSSMPMFFWLK